MWQSHFTTCRTSPRTPATYLRVGGVSVTVLAGPVAAVKKPKKRGGRMHIDGVDTFEEPARCQKGAQETGEEEWGRKKTWERRTNADSLSSILEALQCRAEPRDSVGEPRGDC